jgi:hypothetical protein
MYWFSCKRDGPVSCRKISPYRTLKKAYVTDIDTERYGLNIRRSLHFVTKEKKKQIKKKKSNVNGRQTYLLEHVRLH